MRIIRNRLLAEYRIAIVLWIFCVLWAFSWCAHSIFFFSPGEHLVALLVFFLHVRFSITQHILFPSSSSYDLYLTAIFILFKALFQVFFYELLSRFSFFQNDHCHHVLCEFFISFSQFEFAFSYKKASFFLLDIILWLIP